MADGKGIFGKIMEHVTPSDHHDEKDGEEHHSGGLIGSVMDRIHHNDHTEPTASSDAPTDGAPPATDAGSSASAGTAVTSDQSQESAPAAESSDGRVSDSGVSRMYTTKQGDTLEAIAAYFYGDPAQRQRLLDDNPGLGAMAPGATLYPGMSLHVGEDSSRGDTIKGTV